MGLDEDKGSLVIAEAGVNHNGKLDFALRLCDAAKDAGADVIKFQTWKTESIITQNVEQAEYQTANTGKKESQFNMLKQLELSYKEFRTIKKYCDDIGIIFASTADESESLDFLIDLGIPFIKVGSGDVGNIPFLRYIGAKRMPVILSSGMSTLADIDVSINALYEGGAKDITLLHCTTSYPCSYEDVNLKAMVTMRDAFHLPVGYSDHTIGTEVSVAAIAMGAVVIEKHFTLDRAMEGPDHLASMEPDEFKKMVKKIRNVEISFGNGLKRPVTGEKLIRKVITKRIVASKPIAVNDFFCSDNVSIKRSNQGEEASMWDYIIGRRAGKEYVVDEGIKI